MMEKLLKFNTPSVSNIVATYPQNPHCLGLYDPWYGKWYTDHSVCCIFPEMGRRIGYVFTMVVSILSGCRSGCRVYTIDWPFQI
jgi:4-hydroxy-4-methyl-2-oxoglutarate aldolase